MDSVTRVSFSPDFSSHPGETVVEYLEHQGWNQRDLSRRTGLTPKTISEICSGKAPISANTALALEKALQRPAHFWLNLQRQYDERVAREREREKAETWQDWAKRFPLGEMKKLGLIASSGRSSDVQALLTFLGVASPTSWESVWNATAVAFRQTRKKMTSLEAVSVWIRATELEAATIQAAPYNDGLMRSSLDLLRQCTRQRAEEAVPAAQAICARAGLLAVWVPELQHTGVSGCARWLSDKTPMIALTLRYKTDDQMWFTFFHEIGHILLHRNQQSFVLDNAEEDLVDGIVDPTMQALEQEANQFAADTLIPAATLENFINAKVFNNDSIHDFAEEVGVGPGLVVVAAARDKDSSDH